jgi:transmembrane sensor
MSGNTHDEAKIPQDSLAEAGVWLARLKGPSRDKKLEAGFREWLHASPMNARAFEATTDVWQEAAGLRRIVPMVPIRGPWFLFSRSAVATAVAFVAVVAVAIGFLLPRGITTAIGEQRTVRLEDGTHVVLNTSSRVLVNYDRAQRRVELQEGEALFEVAAQASRPFIVGVNGLEVRALGTSFVVRRDATVLTVVLIDGKVSIVTGRGGQEITLTPGERLAMAREGGGITVDRPSMDRSLAWRHGQVSLDDTPLREAVEEMNRYSTLELRVQSARAGDLLVNGLFQAGDSRRFAEAVALTYGLKVIEQDGQLVLIGNPTH